MNIIEIYPARCVNCRKCIDVCPSPLANVITTLDDGRKIVEIMRTIPKSSSRILATAR